MRQVNRIVNLVIAAGIIASTLVNTGVAKAGNSKNSNQVRTVINGNSCVYPTTYEQRVICRSIETKILTATVRIEMHGWKIIGGEQLPLTKGGKSHATIIGGRYLVTHNHFSHPLTQEAEPKGEGYTGISIRSADGELMVDNAPLTIFSIVHKDTETLVLEFTNQNHHELFKQLTLPSASVIDWKAVNLVDGMELAHVDWNGENAHVDWVIIENLITTGRTPHLQVDNFAMKGSSGGGAFWNGVHIGNIWARNLEVDPNTGDVTRLYTLIALNSVHVGGLDQ
jgi:hypothetical protein